MANPADWGNLYLMSPQAGFPTTPQTGDFPGAPPTPDEYTMPEMGDTPLYQPDYSVANAAVPMSELERYAGQIGQPDPLQGAQDFARALAAGMEASSRTKSQAAGYGAALAQMQTAQDELFKQMTLREKLATLANNRLTEMHTAQQMALSQQQQQHVKVLTDIAPMTAAVAMGRELTNQKRADIYGQNIASEIENRTAKQKQAIADLSERARQHDLVHNDKLKSYANQFNIAAARIASKTSKGGLSVDMKTLWRNYKHVYGDLVKNRQDSNMLEHELIGLKQRQLGGYTLSQEENDRIDELNQRLMELNDPVNGLITKKEQQLSDWDDQLNLPDIGPGAAKYNDIGLSSGHQSAFESGGNPTSTPAASYFGQDQQ